MILYKLGMGVDCTIIKQSHVKGVPLRAVAGDPRFKRLISFIFGLFFADAAI
jgi:hypothetical protein